MQLFGPIPERGVWTAVGLTRAQFFAILAASTILFLGIGGPLWADLRGAHFGRIAWSYAAIPPLVFIALYRNGTPRPALVIGASGVIGFVKWILTALLTLLLGLAT